MTQFECILGLMDVFVNDIISIVAQHAYAFLGFIDTYIYDAEMMELNAYLWYSYAFWKNIILRPLYVHFNNADIIIFSPQIRYADALCLIIFPACVLMSGQE